MFKQNLIFLNLKRHEQNKKISIVKPNDDKIQSSYKIKDILE
jgi:hypothetical protein